MKDKAVVLVALRSLPAIDFVCDFAFQHGVDVRLCLDEFVKGEILKATARKDVSSKLLPDVFGETAFLLLAHGNRSEWQQQQQQSSCLAFAAYPLPLFARFVRQNL